MILNFVKEELDVPKPVDHKTRFKPPKASFVTDTVLVDVAGDNNYGEMLLLDKDGNLVARNSAVDFPMYKRWLADEEQVADVHTGAPGSVHGPGPPPGHPDLNNFGPGGRQPHGGGR